MLRVLLIDNYDSFTYNLAHAMAALGAQVEVRLNDAIDVGRILDGGEFEAIVLSPGPGRHEDAGRTPDVARLAPGRIPLLGVCLGHQAIAASFGARIVAAPQLVHGKRSAIHHDECGLFQSIPNPFAAVRYHSWVAERARFPADLAVSAWTDDDVVMGLYHRRLPVWGVQFHPESVGTLAGPALLANFLRLAESWNDEPRLPEQWIDGKKPPVRQRRETKCIWDRST